MNANRARAWVHVLCLSKSICWSRLLAFLLIPLALTSFVPLLAAQANLTWKDNSTNETGFQVERSTDGNTFGIIATTALGTTNYRNSTAAKRQTYYYRVAAKNNIGLSVYSNAATTP